MDDEIIQAIANIMGFYGRITTSTISITSSKGTVTTHTVEQPGTDYEQFRIREAEAS
jgi:hypothetical protein